MVHEGKKPFKCNICDTNFASKQGLNTHIATVHEGKKPYRCNTCDSSFSQKQTLKNHITMVHEQKKPFQLCKSGDVWGNFNKAIQNKGAGTVKFTKLKAHTTVNDVEEGVIEELVSGNKEADRVAEQTATDDNETKNIS